MQDHEQMPETALAWHREGRGAVLATVIETWGSAPRPVGGQLVISGDAELQGSVSGGCVEGAVVAEAIDALDDGKARVLEFGVADEEAFCWVVTPGLTCSTSMSSARAEIWPALRMPSKSSALWRLIWPSRIGASSRSNPVSVTVHSSPKLPSI